MGWFDTPADAIRQRLPKSVRHTLDGIEDYACYRFDLELVGGSRHHLGIVFALWAKAGIMSGAFDVSAHDAAKIQRVYAACYRALGDDALSAFAIAAELAERGEMFDATPGLYRQLGESLCR